MTFQEKIKQTIFHRLLGTKEFNRWLRSLFASKNVKAFKSEVDLFHGFCAGWGYCERELTGIHNEVEEERKQKLEQLIKQWDSQPHLGIVLQETEWLLGGFGQLRKELLEEEEG